MRIKNSAILTLIGNASCSLVYAWLMFVMFFKSNFTSLIKFQQTKTVWSNLPSEPRIAHIQISDLKFFLYFCMLKILKIGEQFLSITATAAT